jgi:Txe/YoeB family toxin of Txe-Axe toxin-antitoxin module
MKLNLDGNSYLCILSISYHKVKNKVSPLIKKQLEEALHFLFSQKQRQKLMLDLWNRRIYEVNRYILQKDMEKLMNLF